MNLRVLATLLITSIGIIGSFFNAFYGLLVYAFWSYVRPESVTWGLLPMTGLSYVMGFVLMVATIVQKKRIFSNNPANLAIIIFWGLCFISLMTAGFQEELFWQFKFFTRIILVTLVITVLVDNLNKFRYYLWAIAVFIGLIAAQSGIIGMLKGQIGGSNVGFGGVLGDRNFMAAVLCVVIPVVFYMALTEKRRELKIFLFVIGFGDALALMLTYSRAGFLGLLAAAGFILLKSKHKVLGFIFATLIAFVLYSYFMPKPYVERISGISQEGVEEQDRAKGRLVTWRCTIEMIKDHPILGVGFYNAEAMIDRYPDPKTGIVLQGRAAHNTFLQVAAELGVPALILYLLIFIFTFCKLNRVIMIVMEHGLRREISGYALMLQAALVGFFVTGIFINAAFIDIPWHLVGLTIALEQIANNEMAQMASA